MTTNMTPGLLIRQIIASANLEGTEYSSSTPWHVGDIVRDALNKEFGYTGYGNGFCFEEDSKTHSVSIQFRSGKTKHYVATITVHKKKGSCHHGYFSHYYDWTIKSIEVCCFITDFTEFFNKAIDAALAKQLEEETRKDRAIKVLDLIEKEFGLKSYDAANLVKYIYDNRWSLDTERERRAKLAQN